MSARPEVYFERQWGRYPKLASFLSNERPDAIKWFRGNSSADNIFEFFSRVLTTQATVQDNSLLIASLLKSNDHNEREGIKKELFLLCKELAIARDEISDMISKIDLI